MILLRDLKEANATNIKFCVKLGKNASDICAVLSDAYGGEAMKKSNVFEWHKQSGGGGSSKIAEPTKMLKNFEIFCIQVDVFVSELRLCN
jgi:hypothetical protein